MKCLFHHRAAALFRTGLLIFCCLPSPYPQWLGSVLSHIKKAVCSGHPMHGSELEVWTAASSMVSQEGQAPSRCHRWKKKRGRKEGKKKGVKRECGLGNEARSSKTQQSKTWLKYAYHALCKHRSFFCPPDCHESVISDFRWQICLFQKPAIFFVLGGSHLTSTHGLHLIASRVEQRLGGSNSTLP